MFCHNDRYYDICAEGKRTPGAHLVSWDRHGNPNQCFDVQFIGAPQPQPPPQPRYDIGHMRTLRTYRTTESDDRAIYANDKRPQSFIPSHIQQSVEIGQSPTAVIDKKLSTRRQQLHSKFEHRCKQEPCYLRENRAMPL